MKFKAIITLLVTVLLSTNVFAQNNNITLKVNNEIVKTDQSPVIENGRTLVPIRVISENLGCSVNWNQSTKKVTIYYDESKVIITPDQKYLELYNDGYEGGLSLDAPARIINNRLLVPISILSDIFSFEIYWDNDSRTVSVIEGKSNGITNLDDYVGSYTFMCDSYDYYNFVDKPKSRTIEIVKLEDKYIACVDAGYMHIRYSTAKYNQNRSNFVLFSGDDRGGSDEFINVEDYIKITPNTNGTLTVRWRSDFRVSSLNSGNILGQRHIDKEYIVSKTSEDTPNYYANFNL